MQPSAHLLTGCQDVHSDVALCNYLVMFGTSYGFASQADALGLTKLMANARQRGMKLVVVYTVHSNPASKADEWVPILPSIDAAFAVALMHVIVHELVCFNLGYLVQ